MNVVITIVAFLLILGILVLVHELGHFLTARLFGVRVEEFGLGFPPRVYPRRAVAEQRKAAGRTVYSLNALPLGGFVRLAGENGVVTPPPGAERSTGGEPSAGGEPGFSLSGRAVAADDPGAFSNKPAWQRAIILAAGAFNNMVLAMLIVFFIFAVIGTPRTGVEVAGVALGSPADHAGLQPGDVITRIDGKVPQDLNAVKDLVSAQRGNTITVLVQRNGQPIAERLALRQGGVPCDQGTLGVIINPINQRYVPSDLGSAVGAAVNVPVVVAQGMAGAIGQLFGQSQAAGPSCSYPTLYRTFDDQVAKAYSVPPAPNAVRNDPCLAQAVSSGSGGLTGPIGIIRQVGCEANAVPQQGWVPLLTLVAEISADLAIVNLLPIPALDGGRLLFVLISVLARRRVRPEIEGMAHALGMAALLTLILFVSWHDISNWIGQKPVF